MAEKTIVIPNINCGHCTRTIESELKELAGVESVDADAQTKEVTVRWQTPARWETISELLQEIGFPAAS